MGSVAEKKEAAKRKINKLTPEQCNIIHGGLTNLSLESGQRLDDRLRQVERKINEIVDFINSEGTGEQ
jgi:hypothetical protein